MYCPFMYYLPDKEKKSLIDVTYENFPRIINFISSIK